RRERAVIGQLRNVHAVDEDDAPAAVVAGQVVDDRPVEVAGRPGGRDGTGQGGEDLVDRRVVPRLVPAVREAVGRQPGPRAAGCLVDGSGGQALHDRVGGGHRTGVPDRTP